MGLFAIAAIALVVGVIALFVTIIVVGLLVTAITKGSIKELLYPAITFTFRAIYLYYPTPIPEGLEPYGPDEWQELVAMAVDRLRGNADDIFVEPAFVRAQTAEYFQGNVFIFQRLHVDSHKAAELDNSFVNARHLPQDALLLQGQREV